MMTVNDTNDNAKRGSVTKTNDDDKECHCWRTTTMWVMTMTKGWCNENTTQVCQLNQINDDNRQHHHNDVKCDAIERGKHGWCSMMTVQTMAFKEDWQWQKHNWSTNGAKTVTAVAGDANPTNSDNVGKWNTLGGNCGHNDDCKWWCDMKRKIKMQKDARISATTMTVAWLMQCNKAWEWQFALTVCMTQWTMIHTGNSQWHLILMKRRATKLNDDVWWHVGQMTIEASAITDGDLHTMVMMNNDNDV